MLRSFQNFYARRVHIPVKWNDLVLDIGSGEKPHWRADVLCDLYPEETYSHMRSGGGAAVVSAPLIIANAEKLPFKDKAFDFVIASHVLAHVPNLDAALKEIQRVGKAGYIELPFEGAAKINDLESHLWWCRHEGKKLIFTAKHHRQFDGEIFRFSQELVQRKTWFEKVIHPHFDLVTIRFWWTNDFEYEIHGKVSHPLIKKIERLEAFHQKSPRNKPSLLMRLSRHILRLLFWHKTRKEGFDLKKLLQCPHHPKDHLTAISKNIYQGKHSGEIIKILWP